MKFHSLVVAAATLNLAIGAPIKQDKSRAIVAKDAAKRAVANNPYMTRDASASLESAQGAVTPAKIRSLLNLLKRSEKRYEYKETPRASRRGSVEDLAKA